MRRGRPTKDGDIVDDGNDGVVGGPSGCAGCSGCQEIDPDRFFAVVRLSDGKLVYRGQDQWRVSVCSTPGTAWAEGTDQVKADEAARALRRKLVAAKH